MAQKRSEAKEALIQKIHKLLALSGSPNEHEAALALSKAQELLDKANLSMSEIGVQSSDGLEASLDILTSEIRSKASFPYWEGFLFTKLAKILDCYPFKQQRLYQASYWVAGCDEDVALFTHSYSFLKRAVSLLCDSHRAKEKSRSKRWGRRDSIQFRKAFCMGAAVRVCEKVNESRQMRLSQDVCCRALVVNKKKLVDSWASKNLSVGKTRRSATMSDASYTKGYLAGGSISVHKELPA